MPNEPETVRVDERRVACDGATDIRGGAALGHPRVWIEIGATGFAECGYCDRRFVLSGGPADTARIDDAGAQDFGDAGNDAGPTERDEQQPA